MSNAAVRQRADGEWEVFATYTADRVAWEQYEADVAAGGAPGGMSFTLVGYFESSVATGTSDSWDLAILADPSFHSEEIEEGAASLGSLGTVRPAYLYQFADFSSASIVIEVGAHLLADVSVGLLCNAMWDAVKGFWNRRRPEDPTPVTFSLRVVNPHLRRGRHRDVGRWFDNHELVVETSDPDTLRAGFDAMQEILKGAAESPPASPQVRDFRDGGWTPPN